MRVQFLLPLTVLAILAAAAALSGGPAQPLSAGAQQTPVPPVENAQLLPLVISARQNTAVHVLTNRYAYANQYGSFFVFGEVRNGIQETLGFVSVTANLYDENNQLVDSETGYLAGYSLPPGEKDCFKIVFSDVVDEWEYYLLEAPSYWTDGEPWPRLAIFDDSAAYHPDLLDNFDIIGQVRNDGSRREEYAGISGALYDDRGRVLGCEYAIINDTKLDPGQTSTFKLFYFDTDYAGVTGYCLQPGNVCSTLPAAVRLLIG